MRKLQPSAKCTEILAIIDEIITQKAICKAPGDWTDAKSVARMKKERAGYELMNHIEEIRSLLSAEPTR